MNRIIISIISIVMFLLAGAIVWLNRNVDGAGTSSDPNESIHQTKASDRDHASTSRNANQSSNPLEEQTVHETQAAAERAQMNSMWLQNASVVFSQSVARLTSDLQLTPEQSDQLQSVFEARKQELADLLAGVTSGESADDIETFAKIASLLRNKGLRDDLVGILSDEQLKAFDASEADRQHEAVEARTYRDMARINEVANLTDNQKQQVLGVLAANAAQKVEQEADSRAFMSLTLGGIANDMDPALVRGVANIANANRSQVGNLEYGSPEYQNWVEAQKAARIESELAPLKDILTDTQLTRYRQHLEAEPAY